MILRAPAKLNLCLYVGRRREDGLHEICSILEPLSLADRIVVEEAERDAVRCPGVEAPDLAERALAGLRERGWSGPPLSIEIEKRIPIAAGLGGGSADAAAVLRLAAGQVDGLPALAAGLGADVPSQLEPAFALVGGAGELVEPLSPAGEHAIVLVEMGSRISAAEAYAEADRSGGGRSAAELDELRARLRDAASTGASPLSYAELLVNDLQPAVLSLRPEAGEALAALESAGAARALVTGSGPTAFGLFPDLAAADRAARALPPSFAGVIVASPDSLR